MWERKIKYVFLSLWSFSKTNEQKFSENCHRFWWSRKNWIPNQKWDLLLTNWFLYDYNNLYHSDEKTHKTLLKTVIDSDGVEKTGYQIKSETYY